MLILLFQNGRLKQPTNEILNLLRYMYGGISNFIGCHIKL